MNLKNSKSRNHLKQILKHIMFIIPLLLSQVYGQAYKIYKGDTINRISADSIKQGRWIIFKNEIPASEGIYKNNKKTGEWKTYYKNGTIASRISYEDGQLNGFVLMFDTTGSISESGFWRNMRWNGNYNHYYSNGALRTRMTFDTFGKRVGFSTFYYKNEIIKTVQFSINGVQLFSADYDSLGNRTKFESDSSFKSSNEKLVISSTDDLVRTENSVVFQHQKLLDSQFKVEEQKKNLLIGGSILIFLIMISIFLIRGYALKRKSNTLLSRKNSEIETQKNLIEEKNKDITDSITYALRIQQAKLPKIENIKAVLPDSFVLFKPKDIVSGDFYFFHETTNSFVIAAADCTGHGVPGAFMSLIGSEILNDAVVNNSDTSGILMHLNKGIKSSLHQSDNDESTRDGMDIAIVKCVKGPASWSVVYAGANRPLWIIRKGQKEIEEIKATKKAIGGLTENEQSFESHEIKLQTGDCFYIFTDGYADMFGGANGKKLTTKKMKELLLTIQDKSMQEQEIYLSNFAEEWKTSTEQVDDILVIGVRI